MPRKKSALTSAPDSLYRDIRSVLESARSSAYRAVNTAMVHAYWQVGRLIVEHEQGGKGRARYGAALLEALAQRLTAEFGRASSGAWTRCSSRPSRRRSTPRGCSTGPKGCWMACWSEARGHEKGCIAESVDGVATNAWPGCREEDRGRRYRRPPLGLAQSHPVRAPADRHGCLFHTNVAVLALGTTPAQRESPGQQGRVRGADSRDRVARIDG